MLIITVNHMLTRCIVAMAAAASIFTAPGVWAAAEIKNCEVHLTKDDALAGLSAPVATFYHWTRRGLYDLISIVFGPSFLRTEELKNLEVLDAGCGEGMLVNDLRARGIAAYGLDIALSEAQRASPFFVEADMRATPFTDSRFDVVYSSYSVFTGFYEGRNEVFLIEALRELKRIAKPGGFIRIGAAENDLIVRAAERVGGLVITRQGTTPDTHIELMKK